MADSLGVGIIARNVEKTIKPCIESFIKYVDKCVVTIDPESTDKTAKILGKLRSKYKEKLEIYSQPHIDEPQWVKDILGDWTGTSNFAVTRNHCFSKLHTDWIFWCDADDTIYQAENLRNLIQNANEKVGAIWLPYHYALDEFKNVQMLYERERMFRAKHGWVWKGRIHETASPLEECAYVRSNDVILLHNHTAGVSRNDRNFRLLNVMLKEDPSDKRIWLYLGHQNFSANNWMESAKWYLKFGTDKGAIPLERYQALCYCSKAMRLMKDPQAIDVALMAIELMPNCKDGYLELAHSYLVFNDFDKALHWAFLSDNHELIKEPPHVIFINPLDYTYSNYCLRAECYLKKGQFEEAFKWAQMAYSIRPTEELKGSIETTRFLVSRERVMDGVRSLATYLLDGKELVKLAQLPDVVPFWYKDLPEYKQLIGGVSFYTKGNLNQPEVIEHGNDVEVDVSNAGNVKWVLEELDKKYNKVKVVCPMPTEKKQITVLSQTDFEEVVTSVEGRHIINLRREPDKIWCEYDKDMPSDLHIRIFCGQGLEYWSPLTIEQTGCGGSETWAAQMAKELAKRNCQPVIYAMDTQVWDGVIYRHYTDFQPASIKSHLFISSRVPEVFNNDVPAVQRWLWFHDIHRQQRLTPEIASNIDVLVVLSKWHANFIKATYPFLRDAEVIDFNNDELTYNDCETQGVWYEQESVSRMPKIAIIGNGIDIERFQIKEDRIPHRFIWSSSPDRGLKQLLEMWPLIRKSWPDAELKIFYGWEYFEYVLVLPQYREFKEHLKELIKQDGVEWCGRVGQIQLAHELKKADILLYPPPHEFRETYGIAFLEAQAAGVLCFYRMNGALGETIGNRGIPLRNDMTQEEIVSALVSTLEDKKRCAIIKEEGERYAHAHTWGRRAEEVLALYRRLTNESGIGNSSNQSESP